ncbi:hypothetical protein [Spirulina subsalsa]|uniref:hypothetical protein n=1 Tax=Spirulina subsalsa TaxID=54311 RepID=UPI00030F8524|nr:hypothetical protein [Spirulina subsalsa]
MNRESNINAKDEMLDLIYSPKILNPMISELDRVVLKRLPGTPHPLVGGDERPVNQAVQCRAD